MRRAGGGAALIAAAVLLAGAPAFAQRKGDPSAAARAEAEKTVAALENRACPAPGDRGYVGGAEDAAKLAQGIRGEAAGIAQLQSTLRAMAADPNVDAASRPMLTALGNWSIVAAAARASLLQLASTAQADTRVAPGAPHPLEPLLSHEAQLQQWRQGLADGGAQATFARLSARVAQCRAELGGAIFAANEPAFQQAVAGASSSGALRLLGQQYRLDQDGGQHPSVSAYRTRLAELVNRETRTARAPAAAPTASAARPAGPTSAQVATVSRFVAASNRQNEAAALAELADDVVLVSPNGTYRGKAAVRQAVQANAHMGRGEMQKPVVQGSEIVALGSVGSFRMRTRFTVNSAGKISRMVTTLA
ncbi:DUF4440 domain-containing protein [Sandaracinobacter sp. RS1-74]|uniref:nuclear transport factor 2 family protein n=1 Tax=Sandaracinobacteroides sayramensis TaxID=2913411 RepID=UPI001EDB2B7F|nr:nuclear transport factor 2 family protein [Sandaracinobacteroides sayramensis]MCG2839831.1 DUF4440 domain-containing protein [Sandaracinobacteroides sayramensis]